MMYTYTCTVTANPEGFLQKACVVRDALQQETFGCVCMGRFLRQYDTCVLLSIILITACQNEIGSLLECLEL